MHQAETISSQGFKELFEGYGNFNNTRNTAEIETLKQVTIRKGADSLKSGSGALGGSVSFDTKDARDYLLNKITMLPTKEAITQQITKILIRSRLPVAINILTRLLFLHRAKDMN